MFSFNVRKLFLLSAFLIFVLILFAQNVFSQEENSNVVEERKILEEELKKIEEKILQYEKDISKTEKEKKNLQNQIYILKQKINKLNLQIQQSNLMIQDLNFQIKDTEKSIKKTSLKIEDSRKKLAGVLRAIYEEDQKSVLEIFISEETLSDFFNNLNKLEGLIKKSQELLNQIKELKSDLEKQRNSLDEEKTELEKVMKMQILQKKENEETKKEKDYFLQLTEAQYQKYLKEKEEAKKKAAEIRARIFELIGVAKAPTFGEALEVAKYVESVTGVRPAFLLAVMTQESNIGKNVGQCLLKDTKTGAGVVAYNGKTVSNVMKPSRDVEPFLKITKELNRDPFNTLVSCPIPNVGGYGGAMGPAQFIPSTWLKYKEKVEAVTNKKADPWNIRDAFLAAGFYLANAGADKKNFNDEWKAALIYFSGTTNNKYRFYADSVMNIAKQYEKDIKEIESSI